MDGIYGTEASRETQGLETWMEMDKFMMLYAWMPASMMGLRFSGQPSALASISLREHLELGTIVRLSQ